MSKKTYLVIFSEEGDKIESVKDITNPNEKPRKRRLVVRADSEAAAKRTAKTLYTYSE